jgi:DNA (cytosine-5)-methyltransferase 1
MDELDDFPSSYENLRELALFAGAGGGILGGHLLGWRTACAVEWEPYPSGVLMQRQNEGFLPPFPIWDDIQTFDGKPWRGLIDVVSGGFPCQDISSAGKGTGIDGERSSLWYHMLRVIKEVEPQYCFIENSPHLRTKGLTTVLQGLAEAGYHAAWGVLSAKDCGANHERKRMWIVGKRVASYANVYSKPARTINGEAQRLQSTSSVAADSNSINDAMRGNSAFCTTGVRSGADDAGGSIYTGGEGYTESTRETTRDVTNPNLSQRKRGCLSSGRETQDTNPGLVSWWEATPELHRMDDGVAFGMDRLKAIGNGQVPIVAATAFKQLVKVVDRL